MKSVLTLDVFIYPFSFYQLKQLINNVLKEFLVSTDIETDPGIRFIINTVDPDVDLSKLTQSQRDALFELENYLQETFYTTLRSGDLVGYNVGNLAAAMTDGEFDMEIASNEGSIPVSPLNPLAISFLYNGYRLQHFFGSAPGFMLGYN
jgi:hypothetical protein